MSPTRAKLKSGDRFRSSERDIEILDVLDSPERSATRIVARSNSGKDYTILLRKTPETSACSCPSWIFRGAKQAQKLGLPVGLRAPCVHLRTMFENDYRFLSQF